MEQSLSMVSFPLNASQSLKEIAGRVFDQMDVSERTCMQYKAEIGPLIEWLGCRSIEATTLLQWKKHLRNRTDIATATKAKQLTLAKVFFRELYRHGALQKDITVGVRGFRVTKLHKRPPISDEHLNLVLNYVNQPECDLRIAVIIGLMYRQGLRRIEVARLTVEDFDLAAKIVRILGKGREDKEAIDLHPLTIDVVNHYLLATKIKSGPLLPSPYNQGKSLTSNAIWRLITRMHSQLGITASPHAYRKKFITRLIHRTDLNILEIASYSRHQSVETVRVYYERLSKEKTLPKYYRAMTD